MSDLYCTSQDVKDVLRRIVVFGTNPAKGEVADADIEKHVKSAYGRINGVLSHMYFTPLRKTISRNTDTYGTTEYHYDIVRANAILAGSMVLSSIFGEIDPAMSQRAVDLASEFDKIMLPYITGQSVIDGQRRKARSHGVTPSIQASAGPSGEVAK